MAHLTHELLIRAPVDTVDAIVKDPRRWPEFWVGMSEPERVFGDGSPGTKAEFHQSIMGMHVRMVDRTVDERHHPDGSSDWGWAFEGVTTGTLTCHHAPTAGGTRITTSFDYSVPGRAFGRVADHVFMEKRLRRDFLESLDNLKLLAESETAAAATG